MRWSSISRWVLFGGMVTGAVGAADHPKVLISDPVYAAPQRMVAVAPGRRMNIYCLGHGSPTVVLDAGMGDSTISWALVQKPIARTTRVCSYDRAGLGFSDGSSRPSTARTWAARSAAPAYAAGAQKPSSCSPKR